jgi:two-component system, NarL family, nitrate/nitrite response regulator NarL
MHEHAPAAASVTPCRVAVITEVRFYREGLVRALEGRPEIDVVASAPVSSATTELLNVAGPVIVLLEMTAARAPAIVHSILALLPQSKVVALGIADELHDPVACAEAGAAGYVSSEASIDELVATIVRVAQGEFPCSPRVVSLLADRISSLAAQVMVTEVRTALTSREREILRLIDAGLSNKEIAQRLGIVVSTVKNHVHHILNKTRATRRAQAAARLRPWQVLETSRSRAP